MAVTVLSIVSGSAVDYAHSRYKTIQMVHCYLIYIFPKIKYRYASDTHSWFSQYDINVHPLYVVFETVYEQAVYIS
jgi:hypothetical protein